MGRGASAARQRALGARRGGDGHTSCEARFAGVDLDALVDWRGVRTWLYWGMFWLLFTPTFGVLLSGLFNFPDYLGAASRLTFGRLRPVHVNGVIFGAFSTLFFGHCYYLVPRLCGVRVPWSQWTVPLAWVWNIDHGARP